MYYQVATQMIKILLIEDNPGDARLVREMLNERSRSASLSPFNFDLLEAGSLKEGLRCLLSTTIDLLLVDLSLPDSQGLDTVKTVCASVSEIPVIILSAYTDETTAIHAVHEGAQDYLLKEHINSEILSRAIRYAIERKKADLHLKKMAFYDEVTGLINYAYLKAIFRKILYTAIRHHKHIFTLFIDLDHFKLINDNYGHDVGDALLRKIGERISARIRGSDVAARIGGDEFVIVLEDIELSEDAKKFARNLLKLINKPVVINHIPLQIKASIGISCFPKDGQTLEDLLQKADAAMYRAKKSGRNKVTMFIRDEQRVHP